MANNIASVPLVGVGGSGQYNYTPNPAQTTFPSPGTYTITTTGGVPYLNINATGVTPGTYKVGVTITDAVISGASDNKAIIINVVDPSLFTILNNDQNYQPTSFPYTPASLTPLVASGGTTPISWELLPSVTTLPGVTIDSNNNLVFSLDNFGSWTVGIQATDALNNITSKVIQVAAVSAKVYDFVDGQAEILVTVPPQNAGVNQFTLGITDSTPKTISQTFSYASLEPVSAIYIDQAFFDYYWAGASDTTSVVLPIIGDLSGYSIQSGSSTLTNGLTMTVDGTNNVIKASGPPTTFSNSQIYVQLPIIQGSTQVATITREYTLLSHDSTTDLGDSLCFTRPYIVGDFVGLNPLKPWFNSPTISTANIPLARVQSGSSLPPGLSLDANTKLIYGTLSGVSTSQSIIEYYDTVGNVHGTVTITWDTQQSAFSSIDNLTTGNVQQAYSASIGTSSSSPITAATVYRGRLPQGLSFSPNGTSSVNLVGTPTEAGYFDLWFRLTNQSGQSSFLYHRLIIDYINPLSILTTALPDASENQPYSYVLQGFGGTQPYNWTTTTTLPTTSTGFMTLDASTGTLSGTPNQLYGPTPLAITLTDSSTPPITTTASLSFSVTNTLTITTTSLPNVVVGQPYNYTLQAHGGTGTYTWSILSGALPSGISLNTSTGVLSGTTTNGSYPLTNINFQVTSGGTATKILPLQLGTSTMLIDTSGVGAIDRGNPYQGLLRATGTFTAPVTWQVTSDSPNTLPAASSIVGIGSWPGLSLQANSSNQGVTALITGATDAKLSNYSVKVSATDSVGNFATAFVLLTTTTSLKVTTTSLPVGTVTVPYSYQLTASGGYVGSGSYSWTQTSGSMPSGFNPLSNGGVISGTTGATFNSNLGFQVADALTSHGGPDVATATLNLTVQASGLSITTPSINQITSGRAFSQTLAAAGGSGNYTWTTSPSSPNQLPTGISLSGAGIVSGTTTQTGYSKLWTVRVTDNSNNAYVERQYTVSVVSGLALQTGVDYTNSISTSYLGYVDAGSTDSINPRPNYSFYVIATGVTTTNSSTLASGITIANPGFTASVDSLSGGIAYIRISGPFASGGAGDNAFSITVVDSGVSATGTFKWKVFNDGILRATASNAFPQQLAS